MNILNIHDSWVLYTGAGHRITRLGEWGCGSCVGDMGKRGQIRKENYIRGNRVGLGYIHNPRIADLGSCASQWENDGMMCNWLWGVSNCKFAMWVLRDITGCQDLTWNIGVGNVLVQLGQ